MKSEKSVSLENKKKIHPRKETSSSSQQKKRVGISENLSLSLSGETRRRERYPPLYNNNRNVARRIIPATNSIASVVPSLIREHRKEGLRLRGGGWRKTPTDVGGTQENQYRYPLSRPASLVLARSREAQCGLSALAVSLYTHTRTHIYMYTPRVVTHVL